MNTTRKQNILYLVHRVPYPPNRGDRIRSYHLLRFLAARARVSLACLADEPVPAETPRALQQWCERVAIVPLKPGLRWVKAGIGLTMGRAATEGLFRSARLAQTIRCWARQVRFDAVVVFCSSMVQYLALPELEGATKIVDLVDVDSQKWFDYAGEVDGPRQWLFRLEARRLRRVEQRLPEQAQAILLTTNPEARLYQSFCPNNRTRVMPNGVDFDYFCPPPVVADQQSPRLVFLGALDYRANVQGLGWFFRHVWPQFHRRLPAAALTLVGRNPVPAVRRMAELPGVAIAADVPDVRPYLAQATLSIAPLQVARGVQNKVLESLAMAKCVLASPQAIEGLDLAPGESVWQSISPEEWVEDLLRLCASPDLRNRLGRAGRLFVQRNHDWSICLKPLEQLLGLPGFNEADIPCLMESAG